ncbi:UDP-glycosyltransferase [Trifolium repens]|nr:UDP-glycosyltransferase [Trifolium repens]
MLQKPAEDLFDALIPKPSCIISDFCIPWTLQIAEKHKIPRISFHGFSCFCLHCMLKIPEILKDEMKKFGEKMQAAEIKSYGVIINTFEELEKAYVKDYKKERNDK